MKLLVALFACLAAVSANPVGWYGNWNNGWGHSGLGYNGAWGHPGYGWGHNGWGSGYGQWGNGWYGGPHAHVALTPDNQYLLDTPAVAHAKAAHAVAHASAASRNHHGWDHDGAHWGHGYANGYKNWW